MSISARWGSAPVALVLAGLLAASSTTPLGAQQDARRSRIELRLGLGIRSNAGTSTSASGVQTKTETAGLLGGVGYARPNTEKTVVTFTVSVLSVGTETSVGASGVDTQTALVFPLFVGLRRYLGGSGPGSSSAFFGSAEIGPVVGFESSSEVGRIIASESITRTAFGARLGAGVDIPLGTRAVLAVLGGYDLMTDFSDPIGGETNHSGPDFGVSLGILVGGGGR